MTVTRIGVGAYRVEIDGRSETVYVSGTPSQEWVFWNGHVFRGPFGKHKLPQVPELPRVRTGRPVHVRISAPMPATVSKVAVAVGQAVRKGEILMILEAMKMELPLRAPGDGTITAVNCREGELVQPDRVLVELG